MITELDESKTLTIPISCECKCRFEFNSGITINVDVSVKNIMYVKKIIFGILLHVVVKMGNI